jgi:hypothetical protein
VLTKEQAKALRKTLSDNDLLTLAGLCQAKGYEHLVVPHGSQTRADHWQDLATDLYVAANKEDA